ncbi:MAG: TlpA family protein disulfide reductase [Chitinophagales bacterium]
MKYAFKLMILISIVIGCKDSKIGNDHKETQNIKSISYDEGLGNCIKIKEDNPDNYFRLLDNCMVGSELPKFKATSINGEVIDSERLKGKVSIINFWFTTCAPCVAEIPGFNAIVDKFGRENINFISIARNNQQEMEEFLKIHPWNFAHVSNDKNIINDVFKIQFGYPTTYLLNKDAQIIKSFSGGAMGEQAVIEIQNKLVPAIEEAL